MAASFADKTTEKYEIIQFNPLYAYLLVISAELTTSCSTSIVSLFEVSN